MAINIGTEATKAIQEMRGNPHFERMLDALEEIALTRVLASVESPSEQRVQQTAHAHGIMDVYRSLRIAYTGLHASQVKVRGRVKVEEPV